MKASGIKLLLLLLLLLAVLLAAGLGALYISPLQIFGIIGKQLGLASSIRFDAAQEAVFTTIRLPRVLLACLIGASLALCGASMQALFRNPLADPALIGISSGASVAAVAFIVAGAPLLTLLPGVAGIYALALATFLGAMLSTALVYRIAHVGGRIVISIMLMVGIGINAIAMAGTGIFTYSATDAQLRTITFWTLGSLGGASWNQVLGILPFAAAAMLVLPRLSKSLNAFSLNESNAAHLGVRTERVKRIVMIVSALAVGASVSVAGVIGFVGLLIPNIVRILTGPDNRLVLPLSAIAGALLLVLADLASRTAFGAAELPIGILTAITGGPFFIYLLVKERKRNAIA